MCYRINAWKSFPYSNWGNGCSTCRLQLSELPTKLVLSVYEDDFDDSTEEHSASATNFNEQSIISCSTSGAESRAGVNRFLHEIGKTPITNRKLRSKTYTKDKIKQIASAMEKSG